MRLSPQISKDGADVDDWHLEIRMDRDVKVYLVEYCKERKRNNPKSLGKLPSSKCSLVQKEKNTYLTAVLKNKFHMYISLDREFIGESDSC